MIKIDKIIRTQRRSIALIIQRDGSLLVRAPIRASEKTIMAFVRKNAAWVQSKQDQVKSIYPQINDKKFVNGETFWYLGKTFPLEIVEDAKIPLEYREGFFLNRKALPKAQAYFIKWYKEQAAKIISERVKELATRNGFIYRQVKITSARTRWGSCNAKGSLCFSWRLVMAPLPVIDYVVVHELVHLKERNHGKGFWARVQGILPDYKQKTEWLKKNGRFLTI